MNREGWLQYHKDMTQRAYDLTNRKNNDYADPEAHKEDPFAVFRNFRMCELTGVCTVEQGFLVRLSDKMSRITNLLRPGHKRQVKDETIDDTILDVVNYILLLGGYLKTKREVEEPRARMERGSKMIEDAKQDVCGIA
jgi:hypothetical protein